MAINLIIDLIILGLLLWVADTFITDATIKRIIHVVAIVVVVIWLLRFLQGLL